MMIIRMFCVRRLFFVMVCVCPAYNLDKKRQGMVILDPPELMLPLSGVLALSHSQTDQLLILWFSIQMFAVIILAQCLQFFPADDDYQKA
jgi:hypothetical protein